jgi:hypothetical protein
MPNVYVYACNNPSESIIAKRRGYGTIISHNVPPYGRAGKLRLDAWGLKRFAHFWCLQHLEAGSMLLQGEGHANCPIAS